MKPLLPQILHYRCYPGQNRDTVIAHCLDLDLVTAGPDAEDALRKLDAVVAAKIDHALDAKHSPIFAAPSGQWDAFCDEATKAPLVPGKVELPGHKVSLFVLISG